MGRGDGNGREGMGVGRGGEERGEAQEGTCGCTCSRKAVLFCLLRLPEGNCKIYEYYFSRYFHRNLRMITLESRVDT